MPRSTRRLALACALFVGSAATADAQVSIGAPPALLTWSCGSVSSTFEFYCGQSFVVPTSHSVLRSFTFHIATSSELRFQIFAYGDPVTGPALFTDVVAATGESVTAPQTFTPRGGLELSPGALYLALVHMEPGERVTLRANRDDPYPEGQFIGCSDRGDGMRCRNPGAATAGHDAAFEATFVSTQTTTPEPATVALLGGGLLALGGFGAMRRRLTT